MSALRICALQAIPPLGARVVRTSDGDIAVFRTATDQVFALRDRCPHKGGPLSQGIVHGAKVTCPLHNWVIDLASGEATGADQGCTHAFTVRVIDGIVWLEIGAGAEAPEGADRGVVSDLAAKPVSMRRPSQS